MATLPVLVVVCPHLHNNVCDLKISPWPQGHVTPRFCANRCKLQGGPGPERVETINRQIELGSVKAAPKQDSIAVPSNEWQSDVDGPALWREIHTRASTVTMSRAFQFVYGVARRLKCGVCRGGYLRMVMFYRPPLYSNLAFSYWWWCRHNQISREKTPPSPEIPWAECCRLYNYPQEWITAGEMLNVR